MSSQEERSSSPQCNVQEGVSGSDVSPVHVSYASNNITPTGSPKGSSQELNDDVGHTSQVDTVMVSPPKARRHTQP